ncbi:CAP domain-containing protein [Aspergillus californicus]
MHQILRSGAPAPASIYYAHPKIRLQSISTILLLSFFLTYLTTPTLAATDTAVMTVTATATTTVTATADPVVPQDPSYTNPTKFESSILETSNAYRTAHNASSLTWNDTLASFAKKWAKGCAWKHSDGPYGENIAYGYGNASAAVAAWGDEWKLYDFEKPTGFTEETGHFTQLVWKGTKMVGCAAVDCGLTDSTEGDDDGPERAQGWYVVCEYVPGGNVIGSTRRGGDEWKYFKLNVQETDEDEDTDGNDEADDEADDDDHIVFGGAILKSEAHKNGEKWAAAEETGVREAG